MTLDRAMIPLPTLLCRGSHMRRSCVGPSSVRRRSVQRCSVRCRCGFTLMEMLLVLGIMLLLMGISWPILERPLAYERLRHAGEQVMAQWTTARLDAMRIGEEQKFSYQPSTGTYKLTSDPRNADGQLPEGVMFVSSVKEQDTRQSFGDGGSSDAGSPEIWFYPDGTCSDVPELLLRNEYGMQIRLILRGLTGITRLDDNVPDAAGGNR